MGSVINTNVPSLSAQRHLSGSGGALATTLQRLSSGLRINSAKDDAAGLAISERMTTQIRGQEVAARNTNDGISLAQTAEGALQTSSDLLQRIRELSVQSANATNSASDRAALQGEVNQLVAELARVSLTANFNGIKLLDGSFRTQNFQVGANANQIIPVTIGSARPDEIGIHKLRTDGSLSGASGGQLRAETLPQILTGSDYSNAGAKGQAQTIRIDDADGFSQLFAVGPGESAKSLADSINTALAPSVSVTASNSVSVDLSRTTGIDDGDVVTFKLVSGGVATPISFTRDSTTFSTLAADLSNAIVNANPPLLSVSSGTTGLTLTAVNGENIGIEDFEVIDDSSIMTDPIVSLAFTGSTFAPVSTDGTIGFPSIPSWDPSGGDTISIEVTLIKNNGQTFTQRFTSANDSVTPSQALTSLASQINGHTFIFSDGTSQQFNSVSALIPAPPATSTGQLIFSTATNFTFSAGNLELFDSTGNDLGQITAVAGPFGRTVVTGNTSLTSNTPNQVALFQGENAGRFTLVTQGPTFTTISFDLDGVDVLDGAAVSAAIATSATGSGPWTLNANNNVLELALNGSTESISLMVGRQIVSRGLNAYNTTGTGAPVSLSNVQASTTGNGTFIFNGTDSETFTFPPADEVSTIFFGSEAVTEGTDFDSAVSIGTVRISLPDNYQVSSDAAGGNLFGFPAGQNVAFRDGSLDTSAGNNVEAQTITISGRSTQTVDIQENQTASDIASKINRLADTTGVEASARTTATLSNSIPGGHIAFRLNGTLISSVVNNNDFSNLAAEINDRAVKTGVFASVDKLNDTLTLVNAEGKDIALADFAATIRPSSIDVSGTSGTPVRLRDTGVIPDTDLDSTVVGGQVEFRSNRSFSVSSSINAESGGIFAGVANLVKASALEEVQSIDISTVGGATRALDITDGALATINEVRANLGATQNRFESTIANLMNSTENLSASRSRIRDADFAAETAALTRQQILQQAGIAMLAQANQIPQQVLRLLQS
jgi:flagellin